MLEIVRIIENMNINEEQNRAKLIKLRKRHFIVNNIFTNHLEYNIVCIFIFIIYEKNGSLAL